MISTTTAAVRRARNEDEDALWHCAVDVFAAQGSSLAVAVKIANLIVEAQRSRLEGADPERAPRSRHVLRGADDARTALGR